MTEEASAGPEPLRERGIRIARRGLRRLVVAGLDHIPAAPFLAARARFDRRLQQAGEPLSTPLILRIASRRRVPHPVETFTLPGRRDFVMANLDSLATRVLFWTGAELVSTHAAGPWIWEELCRHSSDVIEIGANIGFYTVVGGIAAPSRYTAYEPHPRSSQALRRNLELNGVTRVVAVEAAVVPQATEAGTVELICPTGIDRAMPTSSMVRTSPLRARLTAFGPTESFMVCAVPMLDAIKTCDLVKLDVEGLEADLLVAGWDVLVSQQPAIMVEIHDFSSELRSMLPKLLAEIGGSAYAMRRDHLVPAQTVHLERGPLFEKYGTWDYLLVPRSRASLVTGLVRT